MSRLVAFWRILNLPCQEATRLASASLDCELSRAERLALKSHLLCCRACRRSLAQIRFLRAALESLSLRLQAGAALPGPELPEAVRERILRALNEE